MGAGASGGAWEGGAEGAHYVAAKQIAAAVERVEQLPAAQRSAVVAALGRLALVEPGALGVDEARAIYVATLPALRDPESRSDRAVSAFRAGAACVLAGLVARSAQAVAGSGSPEADAVLLLTAVRALSVVGEPEASLLREELARALPEPLYVHALRAVPAPRP